MKKILSKLLVIITILSFSSCSLEKILFNPLYGTIWVYEQEYVLFKVCHYIEFVDEKVVKVWDNIGYGPYIGEYFVEGKNVYFKNLYNEAWDKNYKDGVLTRKSLELHYINNQNVIFTENYIEK